MERCGRPEGDGMKHKVWRDKSRGETGSLRRKWRKQVRRRRGEGRGGGGRRLKRQMKNKGSCGHNHRLKKNDVTELLTHLQELLPSQRGSQNGKSEKDNCQCEPGGRESPQERTKT